LSARDEILARVRRALADSPPAVEVPREYVGAGDLEIANPTALFAERVAEYDATVHRCSPDDLPSVIEAVLAGRSRRRMAVPTDLPAEWMAGVQAVEAVPDGPDPLTAAQLDQMEGAITGCAVAIATTGTIVLDHGPGQGRRALSLLPDHHLIVVRTDQIVPHVPDAIASLDPTLPMTWVSGPSATSDIELSRVSGVHGPRTLTVVIVETGALGAST
jgi:L-lactate dehydrogenase complex protein LldG